MDTFLTLVIALGGIATGIGAIWAALLARRQAQLTERSLAEQNERVRLNLEVDLLLRLEDRFQSPHLLATRRRAATYVKDNFIVDGSLIEVGHLNRDVWDVLNFFEDLGYFAKIGAVGPHSMWRTFGQRGFFYWALSKPAIASERERMKEPKLYEDWEWLMERLFELSRRSGEEFGGTTQKKSYERSWKKSASPEKSFPRRSSSSIRQSPGARMLYPPGHRTPYAARQATQGARPVSSKILRGRRLWTFSRIVRDARAHGRDAAG